MAGGPDLAADPSETGLVGHWGFDDGTVSTATDGSGLAHHGQVAGNPASVPGVRDHALTFDGDDSVEIAPATTLGPFEALTLSAWIRHPPTTRFRSILDHRDSATDGYDLYLDPGSRLFLRIADATLVGNRTVADGLWHHVAGTWDGGMLRLYVDGVLDTSAWFGPRDLDVAAPLRIGRHFETTDFSFLGALDEVRIFSRSLLEGELVDLAAEDVAHGDSSTDPPGDDGDAEPEIDPAPGLRGFWSFDGPPGLVVHDLSGHEADGLLTNGAERESEGRAGSAGRFDGVDDLVQIVEPAGNLDLGELTLMAWVHPGSFRHHQVQALISKDEAYELEIGQADEVVYSLRLGNERRGRGVTALRPGTWQHLAVTWDGATVRYFLDGKPDGENPYTGPAIFNHRRVGLGGRPPSFEGGSSAHHFLGRLDEIRVYDRALDPGELRTVYESSLPPEPSLSLIEPDGLSDTADTVYEITWTDHDPDDDAQISLFFDSDRQGADGVPIVEGLSEDDEDDRYLWDLTTVPTGAYHVYAVVDDGEHPPQTLYAEGPVMVRVTTEIADPPTVVEMLSGAPVTYHAVTTPPGFEDHVTWSADTMFGMGGTVTPATGRGASFTTVWGLTLNEETDTYWYRVRANEATLEDDPPNPCRGIDCDDGDPCTLDSCHAGICLHAPRDCDDGDPCTVDACGAGGCENRPLDCEDGNPCTINFCDGGQCLESLEDCGDGTVCTRDFCDPATGECRNRPDNDGACCEDDGDPCTGDLCLAGLCLHPEKPDPPPVADTSVNFSVARKFSKNADLPLLGRAIGFGTAFKFGASIGAATDQVCKFQGVVGGAANLQATFLGNGFTVDAAANGAWGCQDPLGCPPGWDGRKFCDSDQRCCAASGSGELTVTRSFGKRKPLRFGTLYLNASVGGGLAGSVERTWPMCHHNHTIVRVGPIVKGSAGGGLEICTGTVRRVCGCSQGRDPWTGRFGTACSDCSRCTPSASASLAGEITAQIEWHTPDGGFRGLVAGKVCFEIGGINVGPLNFDGYKQCTSF